jgi:hypothetical protein
MSVPRPLTCADTAGSRVGWSPGQFGEGCSSVLDQATLVVQISQVYTAFPATPADLFYFGQITPLPKRPVGLGVVVEGGEWASWARADGGGNTLAHAHKHVGKQWTAYAHHGPVD